MRSILLAGIAIGAMFGQALAADLPSTKGAPVFTPPLAVDWTGFYSGDQLGMAWGQSKWGNGLSSSSNVVGALGGDHLGYRRQFGTWVLGVQGQVDMVGASSMLIVSPTTSLQLRQTYLYSVDAQVGYAVDRWMLYAIGGGALTSTANDVITAAGTTTTRKNLTGFDIGAGAEYAFSNHWSAFAEYRFYDFGKANYTAATGLPLVPVRSLGLTDNAARLGLSYRFGLSDIYELVGVKY